MKVLMVMQHINFFRNLDTVLRELDARGHEVVMLHGTRLDNAKRKAKFERRKEKMVFMGRGIEVAQSEVPSITVGYRPEPVESWHKKLQVGRQVINRSIYFRKGHPSPDRVTEGLDKQLSPRAQRRMESRLGRALLAPRSALAVWRWIERVSPPSPTVVAVLEDVRPDVVLVSPTIWPKSPVEADYVRAARSLGIPTVGYVNSWDNLTSKGTVQVVPDVFIVWNEALAEEAIRIHSIPRRVIRVTGAPHLDRFFELRPSLSHADVCRQMGCPDDRPYVVYLCSSRTLISTEVDIATALADAIADQFPAQPPTLVVRPHPTNPDPWEEYAHPGVVVYPKHGDQADCPQAWQDYYNQLSTAICVFGLNTTAFLESVVANRPCLTIVSDEFYPVQGKTGHFRHLLAADFLEISGDVREVAARVARILGGADEKAAGRRFFTEWFLRPRGVSTPAAIGVADIIESMVDSAVSAARSPADHHAVSDLVLTADDERR